MLFSAVTWARIEHPPWRLHRHVADAASKPVSVFIIYVIYIGFVVIFLRILFIY